MKLQDIKAKNMAKIVVKIKGQYLTPRRSTGRMYENRVQLSPYIDDAKVFNNLSAAKNSVNSNFKNPEGVEYFGLAIEEYKLND